MRLSMILLVSLCVLGLSHAQPQQQQAGRPRPVRPSGNSIRDSRLGQMFNSISSRLLDMTNTLTSGIQRLRSNTRRRVQSRPRPAQQQAAASSTQNQVYTEREDEVAPNAPNVVRPQRRRQNSFRQMIDRAMGNIMNMFRRSTRRIRQKRSDDASENVQSE